VWPVHGSVLVLKGVVYVVAGRTMWLDGGLRLVRLDVGTGRLLSETVLDNKYPGTNDNLQKDLQWPNLPVTLPDVLSYDGKYIYMRSQPFTLEGKRTRVITPRRYDEQRGDTAHLFCPTGFLDDSWWHRTYYMYGRSYISGAGGWDLATYRAPAGRLLSVDGSTVYGFGRIPLQFRNTPNAYHLFACPKEPEYIRLKRPARKRGARINRRVTLTRIKYLWSHSLPVMVRALVVAGNAVFAAGPPLLLDEAEAYERYGDPKIQQKLAEQVASFEGRKGGILVVVSKTEGKKLAAYRLPEPPVFNGMAASQGRLFLTTLSGKVLCLGPKGTPLPEARDIELGPPPITPLRFGRSSAIVPTKSHPDFQFLSNVTVARSDLGYRLATGPGQTGLALKKLAQPIKKGATFRIEIRPRPGAPKGTPGNGFLAFGDGPDDARLVKCGFRIAGQRFYIVQGAGKEMRTNSAPVKVAANEIVELEASVDLTNRKVMTIIRGSKVVAPLLLRFEQIDWVGYWVSSVDAEFSLIEIERE